MTSMFLTFNQYFGSRWPAVLPQWSDQTALDHIWIEPLETLMDSNEMRLSTRILLEQQIGLNLPGVDAIQLLLSPQGTSTILPVELSVLPSFSLKIEHLPLVLRFRADLLRPVVRVPPSEPNAHDTFEPDPNAEFVDIELGEVTLTLDLDGNVKLDLQSSIDLPLCMIGETGVVIEAKDVELYLNADMPPPGKPIGWRGVHMANVGLYLPGDLAGSVANLAMNNAYIGNGGFSGTISNTWNPTFSTSLFGMQLGLDQVALTFVQNALTRSEICGKVMLPFFDELIDVEIGINLNGSLAVKLVGKDGLYTLTKPNVVRFELDSLGFEYGQEQFIAKFSGKMTPLVAGLQWPTFQVNELLIDSKGNVRLDGGWLTLSKQKPLNFYGFQFEITKLGFGKTEDGGKWIGFTGGVKLVEGLNAGASVEGLRIVWYDDVPGQPHRDPSVTFNGVGVEFQVPSVLTFKGSVAYSGLVELPTSYGIERVRRFDGDIRLKLIKLNLEIDAALVIGSASGPRGNYNFFAIYLGVELPAGIPLWSTGVALYGMAGLFATQMEPNKRDNEGWYENPDGGPGWYKRGSPGVTDLKTKWDPRLGSLAFGVGVTLGTLQDNGTSFHGKFLLVLVFPGPIVLLEGRGDLLKQRTQPDKPGTTTVVEEPLFRALAVLDNRAGTFTIGLDAQYKFNEQGALIDIHGGSEAFFSFSDANAWHVYLGREEPIEHRIRAFLFKNLFEANAYFMLDPSSVRTGSRIGIDKNWVFGPLTVKLEAFIEGKAVMSRKPPHFNGHLLLQGDVGLLVFGFGATLNVDAECIADIFDPFHIRFDFHVGIDLPWFLPSFKVDFTKEWGPEPVPPPLPLPLQEIAVEHLKVTTKWPLPRDGSQPMLLPNYDSDGDGFLNAPTGTSQPSDLNALPVIPLDSRPHITFGHAMNDDAMVGVNVTPGNGVWERIGDPAQNKGPVRVRYSLKEVVLEKWVDLNWVTVARKAAVIDNAGPPPTWKIDSNPPGVKDLYGSWAPEPALSGNGTSVAQTKLWLWSKNPFDYAHHSGHAWDEWFTSQFPNYPCVPPAPDQEICCDVAGIDPSRISPPKWQCPDHPEISVSWVASDGSVLPNEATITLPQGTKKVKITPPKEYSEHVRRCIIFEQYPTGPGSNPRIEREVTFEVRIPDPSTGQIIPASQTGVTVQNGIAGLDCGYVLEITLPRPCLLVEMTMTNGTEPARVEAFEADGSRAGVPQPIPLGQPHRLRFEGTAITRVLVRCEGETFLHRLCFEHLLLTVTGSGGCGNVYLSSSSDDGIIEVTGEDLASVHLSGEGTVQIEKICAILPPDPAEIIRREQMTKHLLDELARWSQVGDVLEPDATYRLKVVTRIEAESDQQLHGYTSQGGVYRLIPPPEQTEYAYFRTEGPPGLTHLSAPIGTANPPLTNAGTVTVTNGSPNVNGALTDWSDKLVGAVLQVGGEVTGYTIAKVTAPDKLVLRRAYLGDTRSGAAYNISQFDSGLDDLTRYVSQTVPATVPPDGKPPLLPRPVYRAYDVGVEFNANYVDLLYRVSRRDLGLYLYNSNNQPVRDAQGRLIVLSNRWGEADRLTLTESEDRWITVVNDCTNGKLDEQQIPHSKILTSGVEGQVLDADTVYETRLVPLLLHEDFGYPVGTTVIGRSGTLGGWRVKDEGTTNTPSRWKVLQESTPPSGYIVQTSTISGGTDDGRDPVKPGTMLLCGDPDWTDYRFSAFLRATVDDGAIGVVFRYTAPNTYYRFSMDRKRAYRRLVRVVTTDQLGHSHTILAEDDFIYRQNVDYLITIEAIGAALRVYQDGALVFAVTDSAISGGGVGLYCWSNPGARFSDVRVDDFRKEAPVAYRFKFTTSQFTNFFHHLHSYQEETYQVDADISGLLTQGASPTAPPTEAELRTYETLAVQVLGSQAYQLPPAVQVTRVEHNEQALAFLVQSPEPIDWTRTGLRALRADRRAPTLQPPGVAKLTDITFGKNAPNQESVTLLLREATNLTGYRVEQRRLPGPLLAEGGSANALFMDEFKGADSGVLFHEEFGPNALDHYTKVDEEPPGRFPSDWRVAHERIEQWGSYRGGPPAGDHLPGRPGTIAVLNSGDWSNVRLRATLRTDRQRDIGLVFRYQDDDNYYRLSLARYDTFLNASFRRLIKKVGGTVTVLWQDYIGHDMTQPIHLVIECFGDHLVGYLDDALLFSLHDPGIAGGRVGLYCWENDRAYFEALQVESLESDPVLWQPSFVDMGDMEVIDDPEAIGGPSNWTACNGLLTQSGSSIQGEEAAWQSVPGSAHDIAAGADGSVWCTFMAAPGAYFLNRWNGSDWDGIADGGVGGVRIAVDSAGLPWLVDDAQRIVRWDGHAFQQLQGSAYDIAIGPGTPTYIVGTNAMPGGPGIYYGDGSSWQMLDGGTLGIAVGPASRIAVAPDGSLWVVDGAHQIFVFSWNSLAWQQLPGTANDIGVGPDGSTWIAGTDAIPGGFRICRWNGNTWEEIQGLGAIGIAAGTDGNLWAVEDTARIYRWTGNIYHKPGTYVLGGSSIWKDVQISARLRSAGSGGIGVMFRYADADNYYRFSMDRQGNYRRLVKKVGGKVSKLWEDQVQYSSGQTYELTVRAEGSWLSVYLDGVLLCIVYDADVKYGRVGLYCHANPDARFERLLVHDATRHVGIWTIRDEMQTGEPSRWRLAGGELAQTSSIGSGDALAGLGTKVVAGDPAWTNYRLIARVRSDTDNAIGVIFRYVDDDNYYRLSIDTERQYRRLAKKVNGVVTRLWEKSGGFKVSEPFTLTVDAAGMQLVGYMDDEVLFEVTDDALPAGQVGLYCWGNTAAHFEWVEVRHPSLEASALLRDHFTDGDMSGWIPEDEGTQDFPSDWAPFEGALRQTSNIHTSLSSSDPLSCRGTQVVAVGRDWADVVVRVNLESSAGSAIGVLFRYRDKDHYYRFSMSSQPGYRRLVKNIDGKFTLLWQDTIAYEVGRSYEFTVVAAGSSLHGYIDDVPMFMVDDNDLAAGGVGLYCWANTDARFSQVRVYPIDQAFNDWLLGESFDNEVHGRWTFVDENTGSNSPQWKVAGGELQHTPSFDDTVWVEDALPSGAKVAGDFATWNWVSANPAPFSGTIALQSNLVKGMHQFSFYDSTDVLPIEPEETLFAYVYLDPANPPSEVMLQWNDGTWEHRAYWGADKIRWGKNGKDGLRSMGPLPTPGEWVRLEVPAKLVGLRGKPINGMAFTLYGGRATWDRAGKASRNAGAQGTYAVAGDPAWTDYRISVRLRSDDAGGAIGMMFRYKDNENYYCFLLDKQESNWRLIKKKDGVVTRLREHAAQYAVGREYVLTMDCVGEWLTGYLDGVQLFTCDDSDHAAGRIGLYCLAITGARFSEIHVAAPVWAPHYIFYDEVRMPAGTRVRVYSGSLKDAPLEEEQGVVQRFSAQPGTWGHLCWPKDSVDLRVRARGATTGHTRRFLPSDAYTAIDPGDLRVLRKSDGTGLFLLPPASSDGALTPGEYRLELTYHRKVDDPDSQVFTEAGNNAPESVTIDVPW